MLVDLLIRFLSQNGGKLSKRSRKREFEKLTDDEIQVIEKNTQRLSIKFKVFPGREGIAPYYSRQKQ